MPFPLNNSDNLLTHLIASCSRAMRGEKRNEQERQTEEFFFPFLIKENLNTIQVWHMYNTHVHWRVPTCSLTEARMEEVVSVSDLSPLEAGITGATMAPFSCSAGCSGTGIADMNKHTQRRNIINLLAVLKVQCCTFYN